MSEPSFRKSRPAHPVILAAAASVITFSLLGIGAITGLIPSAYSNSSDSIRKPQVSDERSFNLSQAPRVLAAQTYCTNCGVVDAIRSVHIGGNATGPGTVAGGTSGAVTGDSHGRDAVPLQGGASGATAGSSIEKTVIRHTVYRVTVRMEDGSFRTLSQARAPDVEVGAKVRIANGSLVEQS